MLTPAKIFESVVNAGTAKGELKASKMILLGIFAGIFISLAATAATFGNVYVGKIAGACIFPAGLAMVVLAGSELFTGNNLMVVALFSRKISIKQLLKNWGLVFLGNFIGAAIVVSLVVFSGVFDPISEIVITTAAGKARMDFWLAFFRGILCNILVCIAVWMAFAAETVTGKIAAVFFPVMLFVLCGFEHSIADMFYVPAGIMEAARTGISVAGLDFGSFLLNNLLPVTLGNIVGGAGIVGCGYYLIYKKENKK